jgi:Outer membrane lipoprotein carrier protein LolA-like
VTTTETAKPAGWATRAILRRLFLMLCVSALPLAGFEPLPASGPIVAAGRDAAWQPLFAALAAQGSVWSAFTENRWFIFRRIPTVLTGELRFSPARGLSLHYQEPEVRTIIADDKGLAMRDAGGRTHEVPFDQRAAGLTMALLPILRFDLPALEERFEVHAVRQGPDWRLDFVSRDPALARALGTVIVSGKDTSVRQLEFRHSPKERVEIQIRGVRTGVSFTREEEQRFFR